MGLSRDYEKGKSGAMGNLIDRQAAIDGFYEMASDVDHLCTVSNYVDFLETMTSAQPELIRCNSCRHDNNCEIQYAAQAGSKFFCGAAERREG